ncbi:hypothetical protein PR048_017796 [Dryococelus australis]|uniref:Uncharacterized protein n=1 Tax=Dryococelus australis TaxID=614101 RepID=A0ABQ9HAM1_9NEOP|nr:hypothetical protein PR048_017796 [Dryococelus australis]
MPGGSLGWLGGAGSLGGGGARTFGRTTIAPGARVLGMLELVSLEQCILESLTCWKTGFLSLNAKVRETGDFQENLLTTSIVWRDSHLQKSGSDLMGIESGSFWWEVSNVTVQPPQPQLPSIPCQEITRLTFLPPDLNGSAAPKMTNKQCDITAKASLNPACHFNYRSSN